MTAYHNEIDPFAAQWLRNLIAKGLIPAGDVDERSITDVMPSDLRGYTQCHFFAGIGGWPYALRLAGWADDRPCWTSSCPCQPLSSAGQHKGHADQRHLWPAFQRLIAECRPATVFGEQVASADGREWLAGIRADLEGLGYGCGAADLCAAGVGAPHIRQRLYWVADANDMRRPQPQGRVSQQRRRVGDGSQQTAWLGHAASSGLAKWTDQKPEKQFRPQRAGANDADNLEWNGPTVLAQCADGSRRISAESEIFPLAHGVSDRMGKLRGAGNAIVPQVAAEFVSAFMECVP